jgi:hypothetical protein
MDALLIINIYCVSSSFSSLFERSRSQLAPSSFLAIQCSICIATLPIIGKWPLLILAATGCCKHNAFQVHTLLDLKVSTFWLVHIIFI